MHPKVTRAKRLRRSISWFGASIKVLKSRGRKPRRGGLQASSSSSNTSSCGKLSIAGLFRRKKKSAEKDKSAGAKQNNPAQKQGAQALVLRKGKNTRRLFQQPEEEKREITAPSPVRFSCTQSIYSNLASNVVGLSARSSNREDSSLYPIVKGFAASRTNRLVNFESGSAHDQGAKGTEGVVKHKNAAIDESLGGKDRLQPVRPGIIDIDEVIDKGSENAMTLRGGGDDDDYEEAECGGALSSKVQRREDNKRRPSATEDNEGSPLLQNSIANESKEETHDKEDREGADITDMNDEERDMARVEENDDEEQVVEDEQSGTVDNNGVAVTNMQVLELRTRQLQLAEQE